VRIFGIDPGSERTGYGLRRDRRAVPPVDCLRRDHRDRQAIRFPSARPHPSRTGGPPGLASARVCGG
jgi:Holliday junction resolvasome RuvABC endonuclease subunit